MKRNPKIGRLGALLVIAGGLGGAFAEASQAQETNANPPHLLEIESQQPVQRQANTPSGVDSSNAENQEKLAPQKRHRFWDKENDWLFAGVGASRTLDYFSTLNMRRRGRQEILLTNGVVDNHAAFAAIEASGTAVSIGAAYIFHHYEHHKLERWTSIVHIGLATTGSVRNYCLKTAHVVATPSSP